MRDVCRFIRDARVVVRSLKGLAEELILAVAAVYALYTVCRILIG